MAKDMGSDALSSPAPGEPTRLDEDEFVERSWYPMYRQSLSICKPPSPKERVTKMARERWQWLARTAYRAAFAESRS